MLSANDADDVGSDVHTQLQLMTDAVNASFDVVLTLSNTGVIRTANIAATNLTGYSTTELIGNNITMLLRGTMDLSNGHEQREVVVVKKDGIEFSAELGIREVVHESGDRLLCAFLKDLSQQKQHEAVVRRHELFLQSMIDASFDPMFGIDVDGRIIVCNVAATNMFGWTKEEFLGQDIAMICGGGHGTHHKGYLRRYLQTGEKKIIGRKRAVKARRKDGSEFEVELGIQEVLHENEERFFCGYIRDMTRQNIDKRKLRMKDALIQEKFFGCSKTQLTE